MSGDRRTSSSWNKVTRFDLHGGKTTKPSWAVSSFFNTFQVDVLSDNPLCHVCLAKHDNAFNLHFVKSIYSLHIHYLYAARTDTAALSRSQPRNALLGLSKSIGRQVTFFPLIEELLPPWEEHGRLEHVPLQRHIIRHIVKEPVPRVVWHALIGEHDWRDGALAHLQHFLVFILLGDNVPDARPASPNHSLLGCP